MKNEKEIIEKIENIDREIIEIIRTFGPDHPAVSCKKSIISWLEWVIE